MAAIVPVEDFELLEYLEDRQDLLEAKQILAESDERISYDEIRKELGLI